MGFNSMATSMRSARACGHDTYVPACTSMTYSLWGAAGALRIHTQACAAGVVAPVRLTGPCLEQQTGNRHPAGRTTGAVSQAAEPVTDSKGPSPCKLLLHGQGGCMPTEPGVAWHLLHACVCAHVTQEDSRRALGEDTRSGTGGRRHALKKPFLIDLSGKTANIYDVGEAKGEHEHG